MNAYKKYYIIAGTSILAGLIGALILFFETLKQSIGYVNIMLTLNMFLIVIPSFYYIFLHRSAVNIFAPCVYPLAAFSILYVIPSIILRHKLYDNRLPLDIQTIGILTYLCGAMLYYQFFYKRNNLPSRVISVVPLSYAKQNRTVMMFFFITGLVLLAVYGWISGITMSFFEKIDLSDLRRSTEIGKGFIKEPAVFFVTFSFVWFFGVSLSKNKGHALKYFGLLSLVALIVFITTANNTAVFYLIFFSYGLYNKYFNISFAKMSIFGFFIVFLIGAVSTVRMGQVIIFGNVIKHLFFIHHEVYDMSYMPIVKLIQLGILKFQYGVEYLQNAAIIIPRFLWKEKPVGFDYFLKDLLNLGFSGGGVPATPFGSLYLNFNIIGVIVGGIIMGFLYSSLYEIYLEERDIFAALVALYSLPAVMNPSLFLSYLVLLCFFIIVMLSINKILAVIGTH
ncbi:MAG: hypothetical protein WC592_02485 [Candidatus Omnitrophota bacterium]